MQEVEVEVHASELQVGDVMFAMWFAGYNGRDGRWNPWTGEIIISEVRADGEIFREDGSPWCRTTDSYKFLVRRVSKHPPVTCQCGKVIPGALHAIGAKHLCR